MVRMLKRRGSGSQDVKGNKFLISINVIGSAGPLKLVVNEGDLVSEVIDTALKSYARVGRLPVLGTDPNNFELHHTDSGSDALDQWETIGSAGGRNFMLFKKHMQPGMTDDSSPTKERRRKRLRAWINRSLTSKIYPQ